VQQQRLQRDERGIGGDNGQGRVQHIAPFAGAHRRRRTRSEQVNGVSEDAEQRYLDHRDTGAQQRKQQQQRFQPARMVTAEAVDRIRGAPRRSAGEWLDQLFKETKWHASPHAGAPAWGGITPWQRLHCGASRPVIPDCSPLP
jgi:predicted GIY-YIG superfamily endonuclease